MDVLVDATDANAKRWKTQKGKSSPVPMHADCYTSNIEGRTSSEVIERGW